MGPAELLIIGVVLAVIAAIVVAVVAIVSRSRHREQFPRAQSSRSSQRGDAVDHRER